MELRAFIEAPQKFIAELERADRARIKNAWTAVKIEGFRLRKLLKSEVEAGAPGGRVFAPLTELARRARKPALRDKPALFRLSIPVRYKITQTPEKMDMEIGFTGPKVSASWLRIAGKQQEGLTFSADEPRRAGGTHRSFLAAIGSAKQEGKAYALRATTTTLRVPARPVIVPFWLRYQTEAWRNIENNFERKMAGERI